MGKESRSKLPNEPLGIADAISVNENDLVEIFVTLSVECAVISRKLKYLKKLLRINSRKLKDIENSKKSEGNVQTGSAQKLSGPAPNMSRETEEALNEISSDGDALLSDLFYLPSLLELPDLRLFNSI